MTPIVQTHQLTRYYGKHLALDHLSLAIPQGAIYGFIGPNGAGKTTTMRILTTLLKPTSGDALVAGHSVLRDRAAVRHLIGFMPDSFGVYDTMRVSEYLDFFAGAYKVKPERRKQLIDELLQLVDLTVKRESYVMGLSRGMKQRLSLARTLVHDPPLLILDEPASALDPRARIELRELLRELSRLGKSIMISSHILTELAEMCTHIGIIERGKLLASGDVSAILRDLQPHKLLEVRVLGEAERALELLRAQPGVADARQDGAAEPGAPAPQPHAHAEISLLVDYHGDLEGLTSLISALVQAAIPVVHFAERATDLEDIFMQITTGAVA